MAWAETRECTCNQTVVTSAETKHCSFYDRHTPCRSFLHSNSLRALDRIVLITVLARKGLCMEALAADTSCHARRRPYHGRAEECIARDAPSSPATCAASFIAVCGVRGAREAMHEALPDDGGECVW